MAFDNLCKYLAETYPNDFAEWLFGETLPKIEVLKTELSGEPIRADSITLLGSTNRILHLEFQVEPASVPALPLRMLDYWVRIYRRYELPISQVLILLRETSLEVPDFFEIEETKHRFRVVKIWEEEPRFLLENEHLLPFAVLAKAEKKVKLLEEVAEKAKQVENREKRGELLAQTEVFAGLRFQKNLARRLLREDIMKESVTYQAIIKEGIIIGKEQALKELEPLRQQLQEQKARMQTQKARMQEQKARMQQEQEVKRQKQEAEFVLRLLQHRFGKIDEKTKGRVEQLSHRKLADLGEALLDFAGKDDLKAWLDRQVLEMSN